MCLSRDSSCPSTKRSDNVQKILEKGSTRTPVYVYTCYAQRPWQTMTTNTQHTLPKVPAKTDQAANLAVHPPLNQFCSMRRAHKLKILKLNKIISFALDLYPEHKKHTGWGRGRGQGLTTPPPYPLLSKITCDCEIRRHLKNSCWLHALRF